MKAIIQIDVPEYQIGQEVSVYFKDTMCVKGVCESFEAIDDLIDCSIDTLCQKYLTPIPDNATNGDVLSLLFQDGSFRITADKHGYLHIRGVKKEWLNAPYERRTDETDN